MSTFWRTCLCWTPVSSMVSRHALFCPSGLYLTGGSVDKLVIDSATMPVLLDIGFVSPRQLFVTQVSGWMAMSLILTCQWSLADFSCLVKTIQCHDFCKTGVGSASCLWWGQSLLLFNQHVKAVDNFVRSIVIQVVFWTLVIALTDCSCSTTRQLSLTQLISCLLLG